MLTAEDAKKWLDAQLAPDELAHYGVLGMKWGRRKDRNSGPSREDVYNARKRMAKRNVKISNVRNSGDISIASQEHIRELKNKNKSDNSIARQNATRKEAVMNATGRAAVASFIVAYGASKVAQFSSGKTRRGARIVQNVLGAAALGSAAVAIGTGISAGRDERRYYQSQS